MYRRPFPRAMAIGVAHQSPGMPAPPLPPFDYHFFVSPTGSPSNPGTFESPWSPDYAIGGAGGLITPALSGPLGIGFRGGVYPASVKRRFTIAGEKRGGYNDPDGKIIWRNYNGEEAEFYNDQSSKGPSTIEIATPFNWFWGLRAWRKHTDRYNYPGPGSPWWVMSPASSGLSVPDGTKLIHCVGHEGSNSFFIDTDIGNVDLYGCTMLHAGVSTGARAHGFYAHHGRDSGASGSRLRLINCISFDHLGNCGQIFASDSPEKMDDIDVDGLIAFHGGRKASTGSVQNLTFGGTDGSNIPMRGCTFKNIISRNPVGWGLSCLRFYNAGSSGQDAILEDGYFVGGAVPGGVGRLTIMAMSWSDFQARRCTMINLEQAKLIETDDNTYTNYSVWEDMVYYGSDPSALRWRAGSGFTDRTHAGWKTFTGKGDTPGHADTVVATLPSVTKVFIRPDDEYEYGRGLVTYFNWANLPRIPVDLSTILAVGDNIVVRNAQVASPEWNPGATVQVYDAPTGGNVVTTWLGSPVYFPTTGVTPPAAYGFNNAALDAWVDIFPITKTAPDFDVFHVSTS